MLSNTILLSIELLVGSLTSENRKLEVISSNCGSLNRKLRLVTKLLLAPCWRKGIELILRKLLVLGRRRHMVLN
jgi:hypothetical protein